MSYVARFLPATLVATGLLLAAGISPVHAQVNVSEGLEDLNTTTQFGDTTVTELVGSIINVVLSLLGVIFIVLIIYAGFLWMTAGGATEKVDKAKKLLIQSVIGLIIILAAYAIAQFVVGSLGDLVA